MNNGSETEVLPDSVTGQVPVAPGDTVQVEGHLTLTHGAPVRVIAAKEGQPERFRGVIARKTEVGRFHGRL